MDDYKRRAAVLGTLARWFMALAIALVAQQAAAGVLYAATAHEGALGADNAGRLYVVNTANGRWRFVGPIKVDGKTCVPIDGLAVHPKTKVLYAITSRKLPEPTLLTIDPATARATLVGKLGVRGSDIHFDADGTLYMWIPDGNRLATVNLANGSVTALPPSAVRETRSGGLAINSRGVALVSAGTNRGVIDELDSHTGDVIGALTVSDASLVNALFSLTYAPSGALLGVNEPTSGGNQRELISIDPASGAVKRIGRLPDDVDAIAFDDRSDVDFGSKRDLLFIFAIVLLSLALAAIIRWRAPG